MSLFGLFFSGKNEIQPTIIFLKKDLIKNRQRNKLLIVSVLNYFF